MPDADELLRSGDLAGARATLIDRVRRAPDDQPARMFLFQLFCVLGEWDKARSQLKSLTQLSPEAQMLSVAYNIALDAELERERVFAGVSAPALLVNTSDWAGDLAAAIGHLSQGRNAEAEAARDKAFEAAPDTPGQFGDARFDWIADGDARFGPAFEAVIHGRWGLIPFDAVAKLTSDGPQDLRDVVWLPAEIEFKTGQGAAVLLPARYPGTVASGQTELMLGRGTDWRDGPAGPEGLGQKLWSLGGEEEAGILSLRRLTFD